MNKDTSVEFPLTDVQERYNQLIDTIKLLVFKEDKALFSALDFEDDTIF